MVGSGLALDIYVASVDKGDGQCCGPHMWAPFQYIGDTQYTSLSCMGSCSVHRWCPMD